MEGCKIGHIEPCAVSSAQGVIEALRKLRNASELEKTSNRLAEHIFEDILKSIKSNDMEEKKTKKMTKAEAFGYLMHKKVACYNRKEVDIQKKLFEIGFKWCDGTTEEVVGMFDFLLIDDGTFQFTDNVSHFRKHAYEEIEMDDILSIEIVEDCAKDDEDPYFGGRIKDLQEMLEDDEVLIITKTNFLTMMK